MAKVLIFVCAFVFIGLVYAQSGFDTTSLPNFNVNNKGDVGVQSNSQFTNNQQGVQINNFCSDPKWMALMNAVKDVIDDTISKHSIVKRLASCECNKLVSLVKSVPEPLPNITPVPQASY